MIRTLALTAAAFTLTACNADTIYQAQAPKRTISVTGEGSVSAAPDMAILNFSVRTRGDSASQAFTNASARMAGLVDALKGEGIEPRDLQTEQISVNPVYGQNDRGFRDQSRIVGYESYQSLTVRLRNIPAAGGVIDKAVSAGANELGSFSLGFSDPAALSDQIRVAAVKDAVRKADMMAKAAGAERLPVMTLSASGSAPRPMMMRAAAMEADFAAAPPVEAGEQQLRMTVSATFSLR